MLNNVAIKNDNNQQDAALLQDERERELRDFRKAMLYVMEDLDKTVEELKKRSMAIEQSVNIIIIANRNGCIEYMNPIFEKIAGHEKNDLVGRQIREHIFAELSDEEYGGLIAEVFSEKTWRGTVKNRRKTGGYYQCDTNVSPVKDSSGEITHFLIVQEDISEKVRSEERIRHLVKYDELTGLFNRSRFIETLNEWMASSSTGNGRGVLLLSNMDQFKYFNETYGHGTGDYMLKCMANLINSVVESAYGEAGAKTGCRPYVGRVGGDEFAVFLPSVDRERGMEVAERIRSTVEGFRFEDLDVSSTISVGVAVYPEDGKEVKGLFTKVDAARFRAKEMGRNRCHVYSPEDKDIEKMQSKLLWKEKIFAAVKEGRFEPWFQPIMGIIENSVSHYEVLARMVENDGSIVLPGSFVDVAEWFGIITVIDKVIIEKALKHQVNLGKGTNLSINLSGKELGDKELLAFLESQLSETGANPQRVIFEITETAAISNIEQAVTFVKALKSIGCRFALDDFGVGFTSFTYLKKLMVDYIKIDGAFIRRLHENADDQVFVKAIIDVAKGLNIKTIAEFVEYEEALTVLKTLGADYAQGYLIGKPVPVGNIII
ncbi:MAG: hypothetical protein A3J24_00905 [Deltaproteobacteria bacterium RIFCSPLOWO2_02_FULL_53_8]|nr:MAG: hypothetical protein A3J24_00905 [Deltaproteobacteria bacterium RIFCSPLOWO2_02_FULL_53_8]